ncbi:MAG: DUF6807 family protein [Thermomicrobiales bacterium]
MTEHAYELRHESLSPTHIAGRFVVERATGRLLGGVGHNAHRAWVHPLNTPRGLNVVQEYPFDHPFHNGIFVGQGVVRQGEREAHFWAPAPDWRNPENYIYNQIGQLRYGHDQPAAIEPCGRGFRFTYQTVWRDDHDEPVLDETRTIAIYAGADATMCDVFTSKTATYGPLDYPASKHGTIGVRVQPQLLPFMGGEILGGMEGTVRRGRADEGASGQPCNYVAYEADVPGLGRFGVCLIVLANTASADHRGPWFIRDYGMAMFNASMRDAIHTAAGETWTAGLRVVAYDGALSDERVRAWREPAATG